MTIVTAQMSVSMDGFYAGPEHTGMQPWFEGSEAAGFFRVTRWVIDAEAWRERLGFTGGEQSTNSKVIAETFEAAGAYVMGRRMADGGEVPWGDEPPFRAPVFVVTHRPRPTLHRQGGTSFTYVTDGIESAIGQARAAANGKNVAIAGGGTLLRQVIGLGLLDELELHVAPVILGDGMRLLGPGPAWTTWRRSSSPRPGSSPPPTSPTSATRSTAGARWCSTTEAGTSSPLTAHEAAPLD